MALGGYDLYSGRPTMPSVQRSANTVWPIASAGGFSPPSQREGDGGMASGMGKLLGKGLYEYGKHGFSTGQWDLGLGKLLAGGGGPSAEVDAFSTLLANQATGSALAEGAGSAVAGAATAPLAEGAVAGGVSGAASLAAPEVLSGIAGAGGATALAAFSPEILAGLGAMMALVV